MALIIDLEKRTPFICVTAISLTTREKESLGKSLESQIPLMARVARDILVVPGGAVACERCFSWAKRLYNDQKSYSPSIFRALIMIFYAEYQ